MLPQPPNGSAITAAQDGDALTFSWAAKDRHPLQWIPILFGGFMLCGGVAMPFMILSIERDPQTSMSVQDALIMAGLWASCASLFLYAGLSKRGFESVTVSPDVVEYDTGPSVFPFPVMVFFGPLLIGQQMSPGMSAPMRIWRKRYRMPTCDIGQFTLERVGERQRLRVDYRGDRVEVGTVLREPDREWLAESLSQWQQQSHNNPDDR